MPEQLFLSHTVRKRTSTEQADSEYLHDAGTSAGCFQLSCPPKNECRQRSSRLFFCPEIPGHDIPFKFIMNKLKGVHGIVRATPIADSGVMIISVILFIPVWRSLPAIKETA